MQSESVAAGLGRPLVIASWIIILTDISFILPDRKQVDDGYGLRQIFVTTIDDTYAHFLFTITDSTRQGSTVSGARRGTGWAVYYVRTALMYLCHRTRMPATRHTRP